MLHHIHKHKNGIKKTLLAYTLLFAVSFGLFYFFKTETTTSAASEKGLDSITAEYQGILPETENKDTH